jgi:hypothetical protein
MKALPVINYSELRALKYLLMSQNNHSNIYKGTCSKLSGSHIKNHLLNLVSYCVDIIK